MSDFSLFLLSSLFFLLTTTMIHRFLSCLVISLSLICAVSCYPVRTADELISLFKDVTESALKTDIEVLSDLDFSDANLTLPLGTFSDGTCVSFGGVFQGNGHIIKGLRMNNTNKSGYNGVGLFCMLENATVENIVIDSSCSFSGGYVGALSVSYAGSLIVKNATNKAAVNGDSVGVGGFVG